MLLRASVLEGLPGCNHSCIKAQTVKEQLIKEAVTITVLVANTGGESGSYTVVLKIDGVKEAEKSVTVAPGESQDVSFNVTREEAGSYTVAVDGLSGSFNVVALVKPSQINWAMIGGIIGGVIVVGLGVFFWMRRREY